MICAESLRPFSEKLLSLNKLGFLGYYVEIFLESFLGGWNINSTQICICYVVFINGLACIRTLSWSH